MTVLIIDDDAANRSAYRNFLRTAGGYVIYEAEDGTRGLDLARELRPDCILLQLKLKEQSGLEILIQLVNEVPTSAIPVIMVSSSIASVVIEGALSFGASHFLIQGNFDATALDTAIRESVAKQTSR
jgi:DNA-binding NarL/FixJ family response regulator